MPTAFPDSKSLVNLIRPDIDLDLPPDFRKFDLAKTTGLLLRIKMGLNLTAAVQMLCRQGEYNIIDLKPENILVTASGKVTLIDLDSIQIRKNNQIIFEGLVGTDGYRPPEGANANAPSNVKDVHWDEFSLAVVLYQLLVGAHPFAGSFEAPYDTAFTLGEKIAAGLFVFGEREQHLRSRGRIHDGYTRIPRELRQLFCRAFEKSPASRLSRPTFGEWGQALADTAVGKLRLSPRIAGIGISRNVLGGGGRGQSEWFGGLYKWVPVGVVAGLALLTLSVVFPWISRSETGQSSESAVGAGTARVEQFDSSIVWNGELLWSFCDTHASGFGLGCIVDRMRQTGASEAAINFARRIEVTGVSGWASGFREFGNVDLVMTAYPGRANTNGAYVLVNGTPDFLEVERFGLSDRDKRRRDYRALLSQRPDVWLIMKQAFVRHEELGRGGQRFIFSDAFSECRACTPVATAEFAFDFTRQGRFLGTELLRVYPGDAAG